MSLLFLSFIKILIYEFSMDNDTPPNTPRRARIAAQQNEREDRTMDSPQRRRIPPHVPHPVIPPIQFNFPVPNPQPVSFICFIQTFVHILK